MMRSTDKEKLLGSPPLPIIDEPGERRRVHALVNRWTPSVITFLVAVSIACFIFARVLLNESSMHASQVATSANAAELGRDRAIIHFFCADLAYNDAWRQSTYRTEVGREPDRDKAFAVMAEHATVRQRACDKLEAETSAQSSR